MMGTFEANILWSDTVSTMTNSIKQDKLMYIVRVLFCILISTTFENIAYSTVPDPPPQCPWRIRVGSQV